MRIDDHNIFPMIQQINISIILFDTLNKIIFRKTDIGFIMIL